MRAPLVLGILYEQGTGVKEDHAAAARWYQKGMDNGNAAAVRRLSEMYRLGTGVPQDEKKARELMNRAAELGDKAAPKYIEKQEQDRNDTKPGMKIKAEAYRLYKQKQFEKAAKLYQQCADMGNDGCQLAMGQLNEFGQGVPKKRTASCRVVSQIGRSRQSRRSKNARTHVRARERGSRELGGGCAPLFQERRKISRLCIRHGAHV